MEIDVTPKVKLIAELAVRLMSSGEGYSKGDAVRTARQIIFEAEAQEFADGGNPP